jgi:hypothetical protein
MQKSTTLLKPVILALTLKSDGQTSQGQSNSVKPMRLVKLPGKSYATTLQ